jgi:hypothetical protein
MKKPKRIDDVLVIATMSIASSTATLLIFNDGFSQKEDPKKLTKLGKAVFDILKRSNDKEMIKQFKLITSNKAKVLPYSKESPPYQKIGDKIAETLFRTVTLVDIELIEDGLNELQLPLSETNPVRSMKMDIGLFKKKLLQGIEYDRTFKFPFSKS